MTSLVEALGYQPTDPNVFQRGVQALGSTPPGAWTLSKILAPMDRWMLQATNGRTTFAGLLAGVPVITLTTTGAKSGLPRTSPLLGIPLAGSLAVLGTNYGQPAAPAWTYNLAANPTAEVTYRDISAPVLARHAGDEEYELVFERSSTIYPGYPKYRARVTERPIRAFILDHAREAERL